MTRDLGFLEAHPRSPHMDLQSKYLQYSYLTQCTVYPILPMKDHIRQGIRYDILRTPPRPDGHAAERDMVRGREDPRIFLHATAASRKRQKVARNTPPGGKPHSRCLVKGRARIPPSPSTKWLDSGHPCLPFRRISARLWPLRLHPCTGTCIAPRSVHNSKHLRAMGDAVLYQQS